jgi:hypothetical protein
MMNATSGLRQAALLLHAMRQEDRHWLLEQLDAAARESLTALLDELHHLGIPPERELLVQATQQAGVLPADAMPMRAPAASALPSDGDRELDDLVRSMRAASPEAIAAVLRNEPPGLIVALLRIGIWPWTDDVLQRLGGLKRRQVEDLLPSAGKTPLKFARALLRLLVPKVAETATALSASSEKADMPAYISPGASWLRRLFAGSHRAQDAHPRMHGHTNERVRRQEPA